MLYKKMAKDKGNKEEFVTEEVFKNLQETSNKTEQFLEKNQKLITYIFGGILVVLLGYYGYQNFIYKPKVEESSELIFGAIENFNKDSLDLALNGDGQNLGFLDIVSEYSGTPAANLSNYYLGIIAFENEDNLGSVKYLENFSPPTSILEGQKNALIGDNFIQLEKFEEAIPYFEKAAKGDDEFSPVYLNKKAFALIALEQWTEAGNVFKFIKENYPNSQQARDADKFIARAEATK